MDQYSEYFELASLYQLNDRDKNLLNDLNDDQLIELLYILIAFMVDGCKYVNLPLFRHLTSIISVDRFISYNIGQLRLIKSGWTCDNSYQDIIKTIQDSVDSGNILNVKTSNCPHHTSLTEEEIRYRSDSKLVSEYLKDYVQAMSQIHK